MTSNPIYRYGLDGMEDIPLYGQLIIIIKKCIHSGELKPGDKMPSESELCAKYNISRSTVRQTFGILVKEGFVYRRRGLGTFVATPKVRKNISCLYSFTAQTLLDGMQPSSRVVEFSLIAADPELLSVFNVSDDNFMLNKIVRVRLANDVPLILEETYIPYRICSSLTRQVLEHESLYKVLSEQYGVSPHHGIESYEVVQFGKQKADLLECQIGTLGFSVERIGYLENGIVYEYTQSIVRGDRCKFEVPLMNDTMKPYRRLKQIPS